MTKTASQNISENNEKKYQSGFVSIFGMPNVGKSTLMNAILGEKIAIVSDKPQTTRTRILGILTEENYQIVFVDTPGIHKPIHKLGEVILDNAYRAAIDSDVNLYLIDSTVGISDEDVEAAAIIDRKSRKPIIAIINKIDVVDSEKLEAVISDVLLKLKPQQIIPISAKNKTNLDILLGVILSQLPQGEPYYDDDYISDQTNDEIASEIIREKVIELLHQEIPYQTAVAIEKFEPSDNNPDVLHIEAAIIVARDGQKGIIIGKSGEVIKKIGSLARADLEKIFDKKIFLELWVKVSKDWFKDEEMIDRFGYKK